MNKGDIFYSVMQKDNNPFEKPRITKFVFNGYIERDGEQYICSTKTDKWGRHYMFKENQIYLKYEDAIPEKNKKLAVIKELEEYNARCIDEIMLQQLERERLKLNQIAIEELEKVKNALYFTFTYCGDGTERTGIFFDDLEAFIDSRIKELKGE